MCDRGSKAKYRSYQEHHKKNIIYGARDKRHALANAPSLKYVEM